MEGAIYVRALCKRPLLLLQDDTRDDKQGAMFETAICGGLARAAGMRLMAVCKLQA